MRAENNDGVSQELVMMSVKDVAEDRRTAERMDGERGIAGRKRADERERPEIYIRALHCEVEVESMKVSTEGCELNEVLFSSSSKREWGTTHLFLNHIRHVHSSVHPKSPIDLSNTSRTT